MKEQKISIPKEVLQQDTGGIKFLLNCPNIRQRYCDKHHLMKMRIFFFSLSFLCGQTKLKMKWFNVVFSFELFFKKNIELMFFNIYKGVWYKNIKIIKYHLKNQCDTLFKLKEFEKIISIISSNTRTITRIFSKCFSF